MRKECETWNTCKSGQKSGKNGLFIEHLNPQPILNYVDTFTVYNGPIIWWDINIVMGFQCGRSQRHGPIWCHVVHSFHDWTLTIAWLPTHILDSNTSTSVETWIHILLCIEGCYMGSPSNFHIIALAPSSTRANLHSATCWCGVIVDAYFASQLHQC
jgi:hypothetical protein